MRERTLAYTFFMLGGISLVLLAVILIAAWPTVVVASNLFVWAFMWVVVAMVVAGSLLLIGFGSHKWNMVRLARREKEQALRLELEAHDHRLSLENAQHQLEVQRFALEQHLAITRLPADVMGNYPILMPREALPFAPLSFAPGNSPRIGSRVKVTEEDAETPRLLQRVPTFTEMLRAGSIVPYENESVLGYTNGDPRCGSWHQLHSFMTLGMSGSGKSSTVAYYAALAVMHGARLLLIDPDAEEDDSLSERLRYLAPFFLAPIGATPAEAKRVLNVAEQELADPSDYPVLWITDEFTSIMRAGEKKQKGWGEVAEPLALLTEDWAQRGRKRRRTTIAIGQIGNATRTGGTELRASMTATFVHRLPTQQARLVLDNADAKVCPTLATGEVMVLLNHATETYRMHIPYTQPEDMATVAEVMGAVSSDRFQPVSAGETPPELTIVRTTGNLVETGPETTLETAWEDKVHRVREMRDAGRNMRQIMWQVWGVTPGGSAEYQRAREEYGRIIEQLNASLQREA